MTHDRSRTDLPVAERSLRCRFSGVRDLFTEDHEAFRESFASFVAKELSPHYLDWEKAGIAPREIFSAAGQYGFIGMAVPEQYGGGGTNDFRFNTVIAEELAAAGIAGAGCWCPRGSLSAGRLVRRTSRK